MDFVRVCFHYSVLCPQWRAMLDQAKFVTSTRSSIVSADQFLRGCGIVGCYLRYHSCVLCETCSSRAQCYGLMVICTDYFREDQSCAHVWCMVYSQHHCTCTAPHMPINQLLLGASPRPANWFYHCCLKTKKIRKVVMHTDVNSLVVTVLA